MSDVVQTKYVSSAKPSIALPINNLVQNFTYESGNVVSISVTYNDLTYIQTFTYEGDDVVAISQWTPE